MSSAVAQPIQPPTQQYPHVAAPSDPYIPEPVHRQEQTSQHHSPDLSAPSPASSRRQANYPSHGAPPNTSSSSAMPQSPDLSNTALSTPRVPQASSARQTPASRSSAAATQDPYHSARSDQTSLPYRPSQQGSSPYSERQDSARTSVPFNTPELAAGFELDRSRENAGSTPGAAPKREKREQRIFSEPATGYRPTQQGESRSSKQPMHSRSAEHVSQSADKRPVSTREDSTVINRLVVTDPQVDVERERARLAEAQPAQAQSSNATPITGLGLVGGEGVDDGGRGAQHRSRQEHLRNSQPKRETKFGEYILGQTVGEGEFGKVKLGWKKDGGVQVAIKLIRRESLGNNPNRLPKIYREIAILRGLQHPNIVRLHEMVETERHIGIILEYASGGELFDYILNHRYLKDHHARRLFAQLVSGVGYLHKRGIVHRDLKLENLLLDRNKNIIITDFGFANTFNTEDELGEEIEYNLSNKDYVQRMGLEQVRSDGHRRGDLMQTSCGSPCYAAPELVVSDTLYTGRKVDVWSCGVILYAMLAGYLPFDDDPSNPEGDNINLLYKYIVSTPLTFPEYVTPHARDLLRRILVPDPRKRADLFEVARHSWLSDYAHVVGFITSTTTTSADLNQATAAGQSTSHQSAKPRIDTLLADAMDSGMPSGLGRSASVREPTRPSPQIGSAGRSPAIPSAEDRQKKDRDAKRRTVQVEYVAPQMSTQRGEAPQPPASYAQTGTAAQPRAKPASRDAPVNEAQPANSPSQRTSAMPPPARASAPRAVSDSTAAFVSQPATSGTAGRPSTRGSMTGNPNARLPSRGNSYGQPAVATVAPTNVEGRFSQPQRNSLILPGPISTELSGRDPVTGRPMSQQFPVGYVPRPAGEARPRHKRTNTMESFTAKIFGRSNSTRKQSQTETSSPKPDRKSRQYPPVSMSNVMSPSSEVEISGPRRSTESRRSSLGFGRKSSTGLEGETDMKNKRASKRFSFIPQALSRMSLSGASTKDETPKESKRQSVGPAPRSRHDSKFLSGLSPGSGQTPSPTGEIDQPSYHPGVQDDQSRQRLPPQQGPQRGVTAPDLTLFSPQSQYSSGYGTAQQQQNLSPHYRPSSSRQGQAGESYFSPSMSAETQATDASADLHPNFRPTYPQGFNDGDGRPQSGRTPNTLQKPHRKLGAEESGTGGSSSGARRVMNWFRSRGRERT